MSGTAAWRQWKVPVRLTAIMRSHVSASMSRKSANPSMPALVTMIPTGPKAERTSSSAASMAARSLTSTRAPSAVPPSAWISLATSSAASPLMSSTATVRPCRARWWQMARPMPDPPPGDDRDTAHRTTAAFHAGLPFSSASLRPAPARREFVPVEWSDVIDSAKSCQASLAAGDSTMYC